MNLFKRIIHWINTAPMSEVFAYNMLGAFLTLIFVVIILCAYNN